MISGAEHCPLPSCRCGGEVTVFLNRWPTRWPRRDVFDRAQLPTKSPPHQPWVGTMGQTQGRSPSSFAQQLAENQLVATDLQFTSTPTGRPRCQVIKTSPTVTVWSVAGFVEANLALHLFTLNLGRKSFFSSCSLYFRRWRKPQD